MFVYLLHLHERYKHVQHYRGWTGRPDVVDALREHERGIGNVLLRHVRAAGITWQLARVWRGDRDTKRRLQSHNPRRDCPTCRPELLNGLGTRRPQNSGRDLAWSQEQLAGPWAEWADPQCTLCHAAPTVGRHRLMPLCVDCLEQFRQVAGNAS